MMLLFAMLRNTEGRPNYKRNVVNPARLVKFKVSMRHLNVYIQKESGMNLYIRENLMNKYIDCGVMNM